MIVFYGILTVLALILLASIFKMGSSKGKAEEGDSNSNKKRSTGSMATPNGNPLLRPVFAEETDWQKFDEPAYLRKRSAAEVDAPTEEPPKKQSEPEKAPKAQSAQSPQSRKRQPPKQQLADFQQNVKDRRPKENARYEEI